MLPPRRWRIGNIDKLVFIYHTSMQTTITIYTSPTCEHCTQLKNWLKEKKIKYKEINIIQDEKERSYILTKSQQFSVPITVIQTGKAEKMVIGFNPEEITSALQK